jgi:hypothetical protein
LSPLDDETWIEVRLGSEGFRKVFPVENTALLRLVGSFGSVRTPLCALVRGALPC